MSFVEGKFKLVGMAILGWTVVIGFIWRFSLVKPLWSVALFGVSTLLLVYSPALAYRAKGVLYSWIGPLITALWYIAYDKSRESLSKIMDLHDPDPIITLAHTLYAMDVFFLGCGGLLALFFAWLWRGYGLIPIFAAVHMLAPRKYRDKIQEVALTYPPKNWWFPSVVVAAGHFAGLVLFNIFTLSPWLIEEHIK